MVGKARCRSSLRHATSRTTQRDPATLRTYVSERTIGQPVTDGSDPWPLARRLIAAPPRAGTRHAGSGTAAATAARRTE